MACALTTGRTNPCSDSMGGLDYVEFADYGTLTISGSYGSGSITYDVTDTDVITTISGTPTWFKYELNSTANNFTQNLVSNGDTGTTYVDQVLTLSLKKMDKGSHKQLKLLAWGRPHVKITDKNGNVFLMGLKNGAKVTGGTAVTGGAAADMNGYTLTLQGTEATFANFYTGTK